MTSAALSREAAFRTEYGAHRAAEGRGYCGAQLLSLPYLDGGPYAEQWAVRARTFDAFMRRVVMPVGRRLTRPLSVLDLGAGNGWLCHRVALAGCEAMAVDLRDDDVDGLGAGAEYQRLQAGRFHRVAASFDALPLPDGSFDITLFNASLHYSTDLPRALREARRTVRRGGRLAILDSPFYANASAGEAMVSEKRREATQQFGHRASVLLALPFIEYLTVEQLADASAGLGLRWRRHRVRYPLWYETRGLIARLHGRRAPSRFDLWECTVP
jgi:SAM-dependent methyltransferase